MTKAQKLRRNYLNDITVERQNKIHNFLDKRKKKRSFISILKQNWETKIDGNRSTRCKTTNDYNCNKNQNMWFSADQTGSTRLNKANLSFDWSDKINQGDQGQPKVGNKARILDLRSLVILDLKGQVILHDGSQFVPWRAVWEMISVINQGDLQEQSSIGIRPHVLGTRMLMWSKMTPLCFPHWRPKSTVAFTCYFLQLFLFLFLIFLHFFFVSFLFFFTIFVFVSFTIFTEPFFTMVHWLLTCFFLLLLQWTTT